MTKPRIYLISGLGADRSIFINLKLSEFEVLHLSWIKPEHKLEPFQEYLNRLSNFLVDDGTESYVLGVSFGGIVALELAKRFKFNKVFLVSSIKSHKEAPIIFKFFRFIKVKHWVPVGLLPHMGPFVNYIFGAKQSLEKKILQAMMKKNNPLLLKWSIRSLLEWRNSVIPENVVHIHGTDDKVFPSNRIKNYIAIEGGTHIMIGTHAKEIKKIIHTNVFD